MSSNQQIAELAYRLWTERGRPHGSAAEDWREAERQLASTSAAERAGGSRDGAVDVSLEETFPASDPVASHIPDAPPSNADDKWSAAGKTRKGKAKTSSKTARASVSAAKKTPASRRAGNPPVDETDDFPATAPRDTGEG